MLSNLEEKEIEVATKLIFDGLSMAKTSMEKILQSPISIEKIDYGDDTDKSLPILKNHEGITHSIKTELIGELKGTSHLIFSE